MFPIKDILSKKETGFSLGIRNRNIVEDAVQQHGIHNKPQQEMIHDGSLEKEEV